MVNKIGNTRRLGVAGIVYGLLYLVLLLSFLPFEPFSSGNILHLTIAVMFAYEGYRLIRNKANNIREYLIIGGFYTTSVLSFCENISFVLSNFFLPDDPVAHVPMNYCAIFTGLWSVFVLLPFVTIAGVHVFQSFKKATGKGGTY